MLPLSLLSIQRSSKNITHSSTVPSHTNTHSRPQYSLGGQNTPNDKPQSVEEPRRIDHVALREQLCSSIHKSGESNWAKPVKKDTLVVEQLTLRSEWPKTRRAKAKMKWMKLIALTGTALETSWRQRSQATQNQTSSMSINIHHADYSNADSRICHDTYRGSCPSTRR